jgi:hypothetical protein
MGVAWGQDSTEELKREVETLKEKVQVLESRANAKPEAESPKPDPETAVPISLGRELDFMQQADLTALNKWLKDIKLSGFVDASYTQNFNNPKSPQNNVDRSFDTQSNSFMFNMAELMLERVSTADSVAGFRLKIGAGHDANVLFASENWSGTGAAPATTSFDLVEGYVEFLAPIGRGLDFKIGKFATLAGYEVIEAKDDWNFSRSVLFTYAIPLTHTGIRATYSFIDQLSVTAGIVNGWNVVLDNNASKTLEFQVNATPFDWLSALVTAYYGAEQPANNSAKRAVIDAVATVTWKDLKIGLNYDWGEDQAGGVFPLAVTNDWSGAALYLRYQLTRWFAPTLRLETFKDDKGGMTGFTIANQGVTPVGGVTLNEATLSTDIKINDNLMFRLEYRHDHASKHIFLRNEDLNGKKEQDTMAGEVIFQF